MIGFSHWSWISFNFLARVFVTQLSVWILQVEELLLLWQRERSECGFLQCVALGLTSNIEPTIWVKVGGSNREESIQLAWMSVGSSPLMYVWWMWPQHFCWSNCMTFHTHLYYFVVISILTPLHHELLVRGMKHCLWGIQKEVKCTAQVFGVA